MNEKSILRAISEKLLALLMVLIMLFSALPAMSIAGSAAEVDVADTAASVTSGSGTWISGKLTYSYSVATGSDNKTGAAGSVSASGNTLTVKATSANQYDTGGCNSKTVAAAATTTTVTVTNASSYPLKLNSLSTSGSASVVGVSQGQTIASGATFTITVTSPANGTNNTEKSGTVTVSVAEETSLTITLKSSPYVSYTVNGKTVDINGSDQSFITNAGTTINLPTITAPSGYDFKGWKIGNKALSTASSFTADAGYSVFPVIVTAGMDTTTANFKVGSNTYTFWEDAVTAAIGGGGKMMVNLAEVTLPNNVLDNLLPASGGSYVKPVSGGGVEYILPAGVTLQLPYDTTATLHTTTPAYGCTEHQTPSPFRTLTVPNGAKITVNGAVSVDSYVCTSGQNSTSWNGTPSGPHGKIVMKTGSEMTFNSGANLYCYGYINGDGNIYMKDGSKVYELFQLRCWRGGTATSDMPNNEERVFPMNQYYVQNVEAPMTLYKGATEYVWSVVNMRSSAYPTSQIEFIGTNGMFKLTGSNNDYLTKRYHANVDRLEILVHGNMELNALNIKITGLPFIGTIDVQSSQYVLPINNMNIWVKTGNTSIASTQTYGVAFLPSSKLTVDDGASFTVNAPTYFYDATEWVGKGFGAGGCDIVQVGYSTANGTTNIRTADNLKDAELDVNGTVNVSSKLYTTEHGAHITSSDGTGQINFTADCATSTAATYQATQGGSGGTEITYHPITVNNAWLQNGDDSYSYTVGTGKSTWKYDKPGEHWYRFLVDFNYNNNTVKREYYCENNDTVSYAAAWLANLGATASNGTATVRGTNVNVTGVTADSVVTLSGTPAEYIPTFVLSEEEYTKHYLLYNNNPISETTIINGETYYIVDQASSAMAVGTAYAAPTDTSMGVSAANHNSIVWNMSGQSYTSGDPYRGTVPAGAEAGGSAYIYGFYDGVVAYNSYTNAYYRTLAGAFEVLPQDVNATITLLTDCGTYEDESGTVAYTAYSSNNITLDLNGHHALGRIVNSGTFTLELNGGSFEYVTGATDAAAGYKGMAAVTNSGTMTIQDTVGGGMVTSDAISNESGSNGSAVVRNNTGATLTVTGKDADHLLALENKQNVNGNNYGVFNVGKIIALTNVDISTERSGTCGVNLYNYNTGSIDLISGGHMFAYSGTTLYNYGGTITRISGLNVEGKTGINNRNIRGNAITATNGATISKGGVITTIENCHVEVSQYALYNHATIDTVTGCTFIAHPDSAQVDTLGNGLATASSGNTYAYAVFNGNDWWYDTAVWRRKDTTSAPFTRTDEYMEGEQYLPTIKNITNCTIIGENTGTSTDHGRTLYNAGVIDTINGGTIQAYRHPENTKFTTSNYALYQEAGGIIHSITGNVNISATGYSAVYNTGQFTTKNVTIYNSKIGGNITKQEIDYGHPSEITNITASGTWSVGSYYALMNGGYIKTINASNLTLTGNYNVIYNSGNGSNTKYVFERSYTDPATASTEYNRKETYTKNTEKGGYIETLSGVTLTARSYYALQNQGHIGTLSNVTASNTNSSNDATVLNGDSRWSSYILDRPTNVTGDSYVSSDRMTIQSGVVTLYNYKYTADNCAPTIDTIDTFTVTSNGQYALRNAGIIGTMRNSQISANSNYALHNSAQGPFTERETLRYYSGASIFTTTKNNGSDIVPHYKRGVSTIGTIDNCKIFTDTSSYALKNVGHIGTIKNSTITAGKTTAAQYALTNFESTEREYTDNLANIRYFVVNGATSFTQYTATGGESRVIKYDYDCPTIDLIGEGNTFKATGPVIANTGKITEINSGEGDLTTITGSAAKSSSIYNYSACLDARTTTTPYTAAASASANGTAGTATNADTLLSGAQIGKIKNVYINANGYAILNGDAGSGKTPTIGEIGEGTEIYAHCTTAGYHAIYNQANAKVTSITGGVYTTTTATTNAYKNNNTAAGYATAISGGDFKGMAVGRANAIFEPDNTNRQTYPTGMKLSTNSRSVNFNNGTTVASGTGYYYLAETYTVTFEMNGHGTAPTAQPVESGQKATAPSGFTSGTTTVTESGVKYRFDGWYKDQACKNAWNFDTDTVTENTTLYAKWTAVYTVTFNANGHGTAPAALTDVADGSKITAPSGFTSGTTTVTESGVKYRFDGWYTTDACTTPFDFNTAINENKTIYAKWTALYTVTFNANGHGTAPAALTDVADGSKITAPTAPTATGYTFGGWYQGQACQIPWDFNNDKVTKDTTLYAKWTTNSYTVTFDANGHGTAPANQTIEYDKKVIAPTGFTSGTTTVTESGVEYRFDGWYKDKACKNAWKFDTDTVTANTTLYAKWTQLYTITWKDWNGDVLKTEYLAKDATPTPPATPTRPGTAQYTYTFSGWSPAVAAVTGDTVYTAQYSSVTNSYTVTFSMNNHGSAPDAQTIEYGKNATAPTGFTSGETTVTESGVKYRFDGWYKDQACKNAWNFDTDTVTADTTLYAKWTEMHTVTWDDDEIEVAEDTKVTAPEIPGKEQTAQYTYVAAGWSTDGTTVAVQPGDEVSVTENVTYQPVYTPVVNTYSVTFVNEDNSTIKSTPKVNYGDLPDTAIPATPTKEPTDDYTYAFKGWSYSYYCIDADEAPAGATVTPVNQGGTAPTGSSSKDLAATGTEEVPAKAKVLVTGFAAAGEALPAVHGNLTLKAEYKVSEVLVTWLDGNDHVLKSEKVAVGSTPSYSGATPTKTATAQNTYTFNHTWSPAITAIAEDSVPRTYTAQFDASVNSYTVTFNNWDGEVIKTGPVAFGTQPSCDSPTRPYSDNKKYDFSKWKSSVDNAEYSASDLPTVSGDVTYTAVFTEKDIINKHSLTLNGSIGVNFYTLLPDEINADDAEMTFSWGQSYLGSHQYDPEKPHTLTVKGTPDGDFVRFTLPLAAKELNDEITVTLKSGDAVVASERYRGTDYAYELLAKTDEELIVLLPEGKKTEQDAKNLKELVRKMLIYSANAQVNFGYNYDKDDPETYKNLATYRFEELHYSTELTSVDTAKLRELYPAPNAFSDITYYASAMNLEDETGYTLYFKIKNPAGYTVKKSDVSAVTKQINGDPKDLDFSDEDAVVTFGEGTRLRISMKGLAAAEITNDIKLTYKDTEITVNPGEYIALALEHGDDSLQQTVTALYNYNQAAITFFGGNNG